MTQTHRFDVLIAGGGPVGLSLAAALLRYAPDIRLAVLDMGDFSVPEDARASALSAGVTQIFETLGIWDQILPSASPIARMEITDSGTGDLSRPLFLSFDGDVAPGRPYAHMVPNRASVAALLEILKGKVELIGGARAVGYAADATSAKVQLADGREFVTGLLVAADGARSALREKAGIQTIGHDYGQMGIVTTIAHQLPHHDTAFEHFRPSGPFASLPLPGNTSSLVWSEKTAEAQRLVQLPKDELALLIEQAMGSTLGAVEIVDKVQAFPLRLQIARNFIAPRLAVIGDAAHVIHPIAGQGLNLGLKDVAALAETIVEAMRLGLDIGSIDVLERYQRWRRFDTALMAMACDGLNRLFSNEVAPVRALRDLGLGVVDRINPLKSALIRHAAAVQKGPRLLQGLPL